MQMKKANIPAEVCYKKKNNGQYQKERKKKNSVRLKKIIESTIRPHQKKATLIFGQLKSIRKQKMNP